jgi:Na+(H+)/acetate symporter ActP
MATTPAKAKVTQATTPRATTPARVAKVVRMTLSLAMTHGRRRAKEPQAVAEAAEAKDTDRDREAKTGKVVVAAIANHGKATLGTVAAAGAATGMAATTGMVVVAGSSNVEEETVLSSSVGRGQAEPPAVAQAKTAAKATARKGPSRAASILAETVVTPGVDPAKIGTRI